jgi:hypothetical protein
MLFLCAGCHNRPASRDSRDAATAETPPPTVERSLPALPPVPLPGKKGEPPSKPMESTAPPDKPAKPAKPSDDKTPMECKPGSSRLCNVTVGDYPASCTISALQSCTSDGRWDVCRGSCTTSYHHYGHTLHCEERGCQVSRRCERSGYIYPRDRCEDTHSPRRRRGRAARTVTRGCARRPATAAVGLA